MTAQILADLAHHICFMMCLKSDRRTALFWWNSDLTDDCHKKLCQICLLHKVLTDLIAVALRYHTKTQICDILTDKTVRVKHR